jgi:hypothetical protein
MDVHELLERCPGIGLSRADRYQTAVGLFYAVRVGEMDDQIRAALVRELRRTSGDGAHLRIGPMVDAEPFCRWLASRLLPAQRGFTDRARRIGINGSHASRILCGQIAKVRLEIVERVLMEEGSTALWELYGELYDEEVAA